ncbi:MAG: glycosyltransferase [Verrucomicrobia bacterium]|nr:glycosyltransferase [Verrucomicrobiota bacterium]
MARNLILTRELTRACEIRRIPLITHHHDWWFDNRWQRWPEMRRSGFRTLAHAAKTIFPVTSEARHIAINRSDAKVLKHHFRGRAHWLPNLTEPVPSPPAARIREARGWLAQTLRDADPPVWILPCRLLRRKNIAEALLLTRWLRPEAWLVTTAGVSSEDEEVYADALTRAARNNGWRLRLGILSANTTRKPTVPELLAASEAVLLTSIQEGFGLPYLEAAAARRPLIARALPNIAPDLESFGFHFPQYYEELLVDSHLFDWRAEVQRQRKLFQTWRNKLPRVCRAWTEEPRWLAKGKKPQAISFSRLTLTAQLEVLAQPLERSWEMCAPLNPFLEVWRQRASNGRLQVTRWPRKANRWLSGRAYAERFADIVATQSPARLSANSGVATQKEFIRQKLAVQHAYPLLWSTRS